MGLRMQPRNEKFSPFFSKAGSNVVKSAAICRARSSRRRPRHPLAMSLALREGLRSTVLASLSRRDYHPAVGDVPGSLTYRDGDQIRVVALSPESELLLTAYLER
ncbi:hypothetical protein [Streptomyces inhibens]|uniref:hypothetical protein n=1 Tax=Streptomyces inhibens TaxID=2293571 RepID=UPI001EE6B0C8|nr:hypothetical protein [Streptomyces inhibens]UKY47430.1 hypothetical protein KI385_00240 [Streptomyces inhibens]